MRLAALSTGLVLLLGLVWLGSESESWRQAYSFKGAKQDYYALLAHGLERGHLYMDVAVDPRLSSPDPNERRVASSLLDASVYHGHYYLYFGVVPAVFVFLPYHLLTGADISESAVVVLFVAMGFLTYWWIYADARRRYFQNTTAAQYCASLALFAFGSATPALITASVITAAGFYEIAVAGGYLCHALTWLGIFRAWHSKKHAGGWIGFSSLAGALAVGCRPNYVLVLPVIAIAAWVLIRRGEPPIRLSVWAVLPAAAVGLLLAAYNYGRFGSPFEFGLNYQIDEMVRARFPHFSPSFFWSNLQWYFLRPPALGAYFPYVFPMNAALRPPGYYGYEPIHGQLPITILAALVLIWSLVRLRRAGPDMIVRILLGLLAAAFAAMYLVMGFYGNRAERYIVDYQSPLVLLIAVAAGCCASRETASRGLRPGLWRAAFILVSLVAALANVLASLQLNNHFENARPEAWRFLSYYGDYPSAILERLGLVHIGPVKFRFTLPPLKGDTSTEPLFSTGTPGYTDVLYVTQLRGNLARFSLEHLGNGRVNSPFVTAVPGREYEMEVDFGSLYPPREHPWFRNRSDDDIEILKTTALVKFDGKAVIHQRVRFFDSPPGWTFYGANPAGIDAPFRGRILGHTLLPPREPESLRDPANESGLWRLAVTFPFGSPHSEQPVLGSGTARHGNMLVLHTLEDHSIQFGLDQWGAPFSLSPRIPVRGDGVHDLEIFVGAQAARAKFPQEWHLDRGSVENSSSILRIWLDGRPVWTLRISSNRDSYGSVSIGSNPQRFSSAQPYYFGSIEPEGLSPEELRASIVRNVEEGGGMAGVHRYRIQFPSSQDPQAGLPLLGAGVTGDGNLIFAKPEGSGAYRIEMDDWSYGALRGEFFIPSQGEHDLEIIVGPVLAEAEAPKSWIIPGDLSSLRDRFIVYIDGVRLGDFAIAHHLAKAGILTPGANPQGFSTAAREFLGPTFVPAPMRESEVEALITLALRP